MRALLLDVGGVMVAPANGDWVLGPDHGAVLGEDFMDKHLARFRKARGKHLPLLPDTNLVDTDKEEHRLFIAYYRAVFADMAFPLTDEALDRLAHTQVFDDKRYLLFDDVLPYLDKWRARYKLGVVSDAPPSTRRILDGLGVGARLHGATYSCELGVLKPDARIFQATLSKLGVSPEESVYVDDVPSKLQGALDLGMRCVQMARPMPERFPPAPRWDGPVAHDFAELDALLQAL